MMIQRVRMPWQAWNGKCIQSGPVLFYTRQTRRLSNHPLRAGQQEYRPLRSANRTLPFHEIDEAEKQFRIKRMRRQILYLGGGLLVFFAGMGVASNFVHSEHETVPVTPEEDVSYRYDEIASDFDDEVGFTESILGINRLRKKLLAKAYGDTLEVSVGTGRNSRYYREDQCRSITMVDQSAQMVNFARLAFKEAHPRYTTRRFIVQSALKPIPAPSGGYDTIVQTMGLCSTPDPVGLLKNMASVLKPDTGRILLLEHGRGYYDWLNNQLDKSAANHAYKFGCWWNKDIKQIVDESGLEIVELKRHHLGTTWWIELKPKQPPLSPAGSEAGT